MNATKRFAKAVLLDILKFIVIIPLIAAAVLGLVFYFKYVVIGLIFLAVASFLEGWLRELWWESE